MSDATPEDQLARLRAQLAEVTQREAKYRLESVQDYLDLQVRVRALSATIGERGTYIHQLHLDQLAAKTALEGATADLETLIWMLDRAERDLEKARRRTPAGFLRALFAGRSERTHEKVPPGDFIYHLSTSPFRIYRSDRFTLRGWAIPRDGRAVTAIRVRIDGLEFAGHGGLAAPDALVQHGPQPNNPQPGFEVDFETPASRHQLALEAQLDGREWRSILVVPIWCRAG